MANATDGGGPKKAPRLGNNGNNSAIPGHGPNRAASLSLREALWEHSSIADFRKCGQVPCSTLMPVTEGPNGFRLGGLCRCHSVWCCPVCAPEIRAARGVEIGLAVELHLHGEGGVEFGTGTLRHGIGDRLKDSYSAVAKAWNSVNSDRAVKAFRKAHGHWGFIRTVEVTYGPNGWHPHVHWLDFWEGSLTKSERDGYRSMVFGAWSRSIVRQGFRAPLESVGVVVLPVRDCEISDYVTKMSPGGAGQELTNLSTKQARQHGMTPFDMLWRVKVGDLDPWRPLWWEYEKGTRGRRMLGTSPKILDRLGLSKEDPEPVDAGPIVGFVRSEEWGQLRWFGGGVQGAQHAIELAAIDGQVGIQEAMRLLLGGDPLVESIADGSVQLVLGPGDDGGMF
jgi:hypothetical protein